MRPVIPDPAARERFERTMLQAALDGRHLPPYLLLEPSDVGAAVAAAEVVPVVLEAIREAHGLDEWSPESFERVFLGEAMRAWHGDLEVERRPDGLVARTTTCPVLAQAGADARVCQACRALHVVAAQEAFRWRLRGMTFPRLITHGDGACELRVAAEPSVSAASPARG